MFLAQLAEADAGPLESLDARESRSRTIETIAPGYFRKFLVTAMTSDSPAKSFSRERLARLGEPEPVLKTDLDLLALARLRDLGIPG